MQGFIRWNAWARKCGESWSKWEHLPSGCHMGLTLKTEEGTGQRRAGRVGEAPYTTLQCKEGWAKLSGSPQAKHQLSQESHHSWEQTVLTSPSIFRHWPEAVCGKCGLHANMGMDLSSAAGACGQLSSPWRPWGTFFWLPQTSISRPCRRVVDRICPGIRLPVFEFWLCSY